MFQCSILFKIAPFFDPMLFLLDADPNSKEAINVFRHKGVHCSTV